ncbi:peptidase S41 [Sediminibacterium roseum]|uniref:Peptidase S41 n=1 Tax=Sediminibacterium roseum TaxID=1978412 RepID=A0ABW9ZT36_9BACT|nr:S41 family peptidase [Sediminibacterium roseum]NCI48353.1 peptidase S41 [Sediminibacterium roseum]
MVRYGIVAIGIVLLGACTATQKPLRALPKKSAAALKSDFVLFQKILEANHPSLYWYTPKDSMDLYFSQGINSISDSMNEVEFRNRVAWVVSRIRCGHTTVLPSKKFPATQYRFPSFPLYLKTWEDSLVVIGNLFQKDSIFKRGTIITGINGRSNQQILDSIFQFISSDGNAFNYKSQVLSGNFPVWYKNIFGLDSSYRVSYIDSTGKEAMAVLKNFRPVADTSKRAKPGTITVPFKKPTRREIRRAQLLAKRVMVIDTALSTAIIRLTTFSSGRLRTFFRQSFRKIKEQKIEHVVLDLRENGGGDVSTSILLTKYLSDHPFKVGDSVFAISRKFKYHKYIHPTLQYWLAMNFGSRKMEDGLVHYRRYERKLFEPKKKYHFDGQLTLLQGGYSFSATTMFVANLKGQKNTTVAGEESGGGYYGNSAMYLPTITLPNSKIRISLPMYRLVMDASRPKGRGIIPDLPIPPSVQAIRNGTDVKLFTIHELIRNGKL